MGRKEEESVNDPSRRNNSGIQDGQLKKAGSRNKPERQS